jgi:archaellum component FlaC
MSFNNRTRARNTVLMVFLLAFAILAVAGLASVKASIPVNGDTPIIGSSGIQGSIDGAVPGDTVMIPSGTYIEQLWVNKSLTIIGEGSENTFLVCPDEIIEPYALVTIQRGANVTFSDITLKGMMPGDTVAGILIRGPGSWGEISNVRFVNMDNEGVHEMSTILVDDRASAQINENQFEGASAAAIVLKGTSALVFNNIITGNGTQQIEGLPGPYEQAGIIVSNGSIADIGPNNVISNFGNSEGGYGIEATGAKDLMVHDNTLVGSTDGPNNGAGVLIMVTDSARVYGNDISNFGTGIEVSSSSDIIITGNNISQNLGAIVVRSTGDEVTVKWNNIVDNFLFAITNYDVLLEMNAQFNFYGYNDIIPPAEAGPGMNIVGLAAYSPWLGSETGSIPQTYYVDHTGLIGDALDHAVDGDTVTVRPGVYPETLTIDHAIFLFGPNFDGSGAVENATITATGNGLTMITVNTADVVMGGFVLEGNGYAGVTGISSTGKDGLKIIFNLFGNMMNGTVLSGAADNIFIGGNEFGQLSGTGISISNNSYAEITENVFQNVFSGIVAFHFDGPGSSLIISGNGIDSDGGYGMAIYDLSGDANSVDFTIGGNMISSSGTFLPFSPVLLASIIQVPVSFSGNSIDGNGLSDVGLLLFNCFTDNALVISDLTIADVGVGIETADFVDQFYLGYATVDAAYVLEGVTVNNASEAALLIDSTTAGNLVTVLVTQAMFTDVHEGVHVKGNMSAIVINPEVDDPLILNNVESYFFDLDSSFADIDATHVVFEFNGSVADTTDHASAYKIENMLYHVTDDAFLGFVMISDGVAYVIDGKFIQNAIGISVDNGHFLTVSTIYVDHGTYIETLLVTARDLTFIGAGTSDWPTVIHAPDTFDGEAVMLTVERGSDLEISGFTFNGTRGPGAEDIVAGIWVAGDSNVNTHNNIFTNITNADGEVAFCILVGSDGGQVTESSGTASISFNVFSNFGTGAVWTDGVGSSSQISHNMMVAGGPHHGQGQAVVLFSDHATGSVGFNLIEKVGGELGYAAYGILIDGASNIAIDNNTVGGEGVSDGSFGILVMGQVDAQTNVNISWNNVRLFDSNVMLIDVDHVNLIHNQIDNASNDNLVIESSSNVDVLNNNITDAAGDGVSAYALGDGVVVNYNNIVGNAGHGASNTPDTPVLNALHNWWGDISGPGHYPVALGTGNAVTDNVLYSPWLNMPYPQGRDISKLSNNSMTIDENDPMLPIPEVPVSATMEGSGSMDISAITYDGMPIGRFFGADMNVYVDVRIDGVTGTSDVLTLRVYFDAQSHPQINLNDLTLYVYSNGIWQNWDQSQVNVSGGYVEAWFYPDQFSVLGGTPLLIGAPQIQIEPTEIGAGEGFSVHINGQAFGSNNRLQYWLDDQFQGVLYPTTDAFGNLSVDVVLPGLREGTYRLMIEDEAGLNASANLTVVRSQNVPLNVQVHFGSMYFRGEEAQGYVEVSLNGVPFNISIDNLVATMFFKGASIANPTVTATDVIGMYYVAMQVPADASAGTYEIQVTATDGTHSGVGMGGFQISATLQGWDAAITNIDGNVVTIMTRIGEIQVDLSAMNATVNGINGTTVSIHTNLGDLNATVELVHAQVIEINGNLATIRTTLGTVDVNTSSIHAQVEAIYGLTATIRTDVGLVNASVNDIQARVVEIQGNMTTVITSLGSIQVSLVSLHAKIESLNGTVAMIQTDLGLVKANISDIRLRVISIQGDTVIMFTDLVSIQGTVAEINGTMATVNTDLGQVLVDVESIAGKTNGIDSSTVIGIGVSTILAIIVLMVVILRTKKK